MVHNLRLELDIDIEAINCLQHLLRDGMLPPEDDENVWGDDCSSNEESDNDMVVGAYYQDDLDGNDPVGGSCVEQ